MARRKDLKTSIETEIVEMVQAKDKEPSDGRLKLLALGIKLLAVNAKLEENDFGDFFRDADTGDTKSPGEKPAGGRRTNGSAGA